MGWGQLRNCVSTNCVVNWNRVWKCLRSLLRVKSLSNPNSNYEPNQTYLNNLYFLFGKKTATQCKWAWRLQKDHVHLTTCFAFFSIGRCIRLYLYNSSNFALLEYKTGAPSLPHGGGRKKRPCGTLIFYTHNPHWWSACHILVGEESESLWNQYADIIKMIFILETWNSRQDIPMKYENYFRLPDMMWLWEVQI